MKRKIVNGVVYILMVALLSSCGNIASGGALGVETASTVIEMEITSSYDDTDPFINERLFFVSGESESVDFGVNFQMKGKSGLLEIADNETKEVIWENAWNDNAEEKFDISLRNLRKDMEYVIRLTCTNVEHAKLVMTSDSRLVKERERPRRPDRN